MIADYVPAVLLDSPAAFWELQDAGDYPQDSSGNGKHMDASGVGTFNSPGLTYRDNLGPRSAFDVRARQAYVARTADAVLGVVDNLTMEVWLSLLVPGNATLTLFAVDSAGSQSTGAMGANGFGIGEQSNSGTVRIDVSNGSTKTSSGNSTLAFTNPTPHHIVAVRRSGTWELWVDGVQDTAIGTFTSTPGHGSIVRIGGAQTTFNIAGAFSFAALYATPLSPSRIAAHYAAMQLWGNAQVAQDEHPDALVAGGFTTKDARQGLVPDRPPHDADYNELSWLSPEGGGIEYADGAGGSLFT